MHLVKLASSIFMLILLSACSSTQTTSVEQADEFDPNLLPATAAGGLSAPNGYIRYWEYSNITDNSVAGIYASPDYPLLYSKSSRLKSMTKSVNLSNGGARMAGYLFPAITGVYRFKLEASSGGELWISTDKKAYKKRKLIHLDTGTSTSVTSATSKTLVMLEAGKPYFIEAIAKINKPKDRLAVYWSYPMPSTTGETTMSAMEVVPGNAMYSYGRNKVETPTLDYIDGLKAGYALGYSDALLGLDYSDTYPPVDSDYDSIPDKWEEAYGLDPLNYQDASHDHDGDGLSAFEEYGARTEPYIADTDNDGIPDGWEIEKGLNPHYAGDALEDRIGDGITNLNEWQIAVGIALPPGQITPPSGQNGLAISWQAPTERVNGEAFTESDVQKYIIHYKLLGTEEYIEETVDDPNATEYFIQGVEPGTYSVAISVIDHDGLESSLSAVKEITVE